MYGLLDYGKMMADGVRRRAYERALREVITPGCHVLDVGCGLGIFSLMACRLGAGRVDAIEPNPCIEVARQIIRDNGFSDRVRFFAEPVQEVTLDRPADVMVADLRGVLPMAGHHLTAVAEARQRLLRSDGVLIPQRDELWAAAVEDPQLYDQQVRPWLDGDLGFDFDAARRLTVHGWCKARVAPEQLVTAAASWAEIDYPSRQHADVRGRLELPVERSATSHGLVVWFDCRLTDDVRLSNAPGRPELIYGSAFFPFAEPLAVEPDDLLQVEIDAVLVGAEYVWTWSTRHLRAGQELASFRQSTFFSVVLVPERLARQSADFRPRRDPEGDVDRYILQLMDGVRSVADISQSLRGEFPERFPDLASALQRVADLSRRYG